MKIYVWINNLYLNIDYMKLETTQNRVISKGENQSWSRCFPEVPIETQQFIPAISSPFLSQCEYDCECPQSC